MIEQLKFNRRQILKSSGSTITLAALAQLHADDSTVKPNYLIPAKAKHIIYICHSGGQSQLDMYDYKPELKKWHGKELPKSVRGNQRLTTMTSDQAHIKIAASKYKFQPNKLVASPHGALDKICKK
jgi:hypothetical protein